MKVGIAEKRQRAGALQKLAQFSRTFHIQAAARKNPSSPSKWAVKDAPAFGVRLPSGAFRHDAWHNELLTKVALAFIAGMLLTASSLAAEKMNFTTVDIFVDSGSQPLAAFQIEFRTGQVKIIGIEGGEHEAFKHPARYDPKALQQNRVILAAFSTASPVQLPKGKTRVATLHIQALEQAIDGNLRAIVVANARGERIDAVVDWRERVKQ